MSQSPDESPDLPNRNTSPPLPPILSEHEFSDIPMLTVPKKPINWSQAAHEQNSTATLIRQQPTPDSEPANESEVVILDDANNHVNDEELDAVAQVLEDWNPMADEHFKEKRKLQQITPEKNNLLTVHFENIPLSITKESFCNMLKRAGDPKNIFMAKHKQKEANFANASFATHQEYDRAFQEFNNFTIEGNKIRLSPGKPSGIELLRIRDSFSALPNSMSFPNSAQEVDKPKELFPKMTSSSNIPDELPSLPSSSSPSPDPKSDADPKPPAPVPIPAPFYPPNSLVPIRAQLHLLANGGHQSLAPTHRVPRMPAKPPLAYPPAPPKAQTQAPPPFKESESHQNLYCDGPIKIAEHSDDEGFEVSVDPIDPALVDSLTSSLQAIPGADNSLNPNLDGTPTMPNSHSTTESKFPPHKEKRQSGQTDQGQVDSSSTQANEFLVPARGYTNGFDGLEPTASSSEARHLLFTDTSDLYTLEREFPFMVTHSSDIMSVYGILGFHDDVQKFSVLRDELKKLCDKPNQPLSVDLLISNTLYIHLDAQGDAFRALYNGGKSVLHLVDMGKLLNTGEDSLFPITPWLADLPYLNVKFKLNDVRIPITLPKSEMYEISRQFIKHFQIYIARKSGRDKQGNIYIDLIDQATNMVINHKILEYLEAQYGASAVNLTPKPPSSNPSQFNFPANPGSSQEVYFCRDIAYHEPPQYTTCKITTLYISSPSLIYALETHSEAESKLSNLQTDLNKQANSFPTVQHLELGLFVAAYRNDTSLWCRAEVVQIFTESKCAIFYLDFGCHEAVSVDKLKTPSKVFTTLPRQALRFSLNNVHCLNPTGEWDQLATDVIKGHCNSKQRMIRIVSKVEEVFLVTLFEDDSCQKSINENLVELGLASSMPPASSMRSHSAEPLGLPNSDPISPMYEPPSSAPNTFQGEERNNRYKSFNEQNRREHSSRQGFYPNQDAQSHNNQSRDRQSYQGQRNSYRANKFNQNQNQDRQGFNRNNDRQGFNVQDSNKGNTKLSPNRSQSRGFNRTEIKQMTQYKPMVERPQNQTSSSPKKSRNCSSDTFAPHSSIPIFLASNLEKFCPAFENARKDRIPIEITHISNPNDFWVTPVRERERFKIFIKKLRSASEPLRITGNFNPQLGRMCLYWDESNDLNRAEIIAANQDDNVSIFLIDVGSMIETKLSNIQPAPFAILDYNSPLALNCSLADIRPKAGGWSNSETEIFRTMVSNRVLNMSSANLKQVDLWDPSNQDSPHVNLQFDAVRNRTLTTPVPFDSPSMIQYSPNLFPTNGETQVIVTDLLTTKVIRVQISQDVVDQMHLINSKLKSLEFSYADQIKPDMPCLAEFSEDNQWYRAKVLTIQESGLIVEFIDFGNKEEMHTNQIRALPIELLHPPPLAHNCLIYQVSELGGNWSVDIRQKLGRHINSTATALWRGESNRMPIVELFRSDGGDLISMTEDLKRIVSSTQHTAPNSIPTGPSPTPKRSFFTDLQPQALEIGRPYPSILFSCTSPHDIWIIRASDVQELGKLSEAMTQYSKQTACIPQFVPNRQEVCRYHSTSDNKIYRCMVEAVDEGQLHAYINLFDMVDTKWVELTHLQPLDPAFLSLPPLAFHCKLDNTVPIEATWSPNIQDELLGLLKDKDISVEARGRSEDLFIVDISSDMFISLTEDLTFRGLARCTGVTYLNATNLTIQSLPMVSDYFQVFILEVISPSLFYVSVIDRTVQQNQTTIMERLASVCASSKRIPFKPFVGMLCASQYKDNAWYRVKVTAVQKSTLTICYIDFGNCEQTTIDKVVPLTDPSFLTFPAQAIQCCLGNIQHIENWPHQTVNRLRELIFDKLINAKILELNGTLFSLELVDTSLAKDVNISNELIQANLASSLYQVPAQPTQPPQPVSMSGIQVPLAMLSLQQQPSPALAPMPTQPVTNIPQYSTQPHTPVPTSQQIPMSQHYPVHSHLPQSNPGVLQPTALSMQTQNSHTVPSPTQHQVIQPPPLAYPPPPSNPIPPPVKRLPPPNPPYTKLFKCIICSQSSPVELTVQCVDEAIFQGMRKVNDVIATQLQCSPSFTSCEVGNYCLACFKEDKTWYRACITKVNGTVIEVNFVDYGNVEEQVLAELRQMPQELLNIPPLCYHVKLAGVTPSSHESASKCIQYLKGFSAACTNLTAEIIDKATDSIELYLDDVNIIDNLILSGSFILTAPPFKLEHLPTDNYVKAAVIDPKSPDDFYLNCGEREQELGVLFEEMRAYCLQTSQDSSSPSLVRGTLCLALFSTDNNWYRAKITGILNPEHVVVQFIDYGNKETVPRANIRVPLSKFLSLPAQSMRCTLFQGGPPPNIHEIKDKFLLAVSNRTLFARSLGVGIENRTYIELLNEQFHKILELISQSH